MRRKKHGCQHEPPCAGTTLVPMASPPAPVVVETQSGFEVWPGEPEDNKIIATFSKLEDANLFVTARATTPSPLTEEQAKERARKIVGTVFRNTDEREIERLNAHIKDLNHDMEKMEEGYGEAFESGYECAEHQ